MVLKTLQFRKSAEEKIELKKITTKYLANSRSTKRKRKMKCKFTCFECFYDTCWFHFSPKWPMTKKTKIKLEFFRIKSLKC